MIVDEFATYEPRKMGQTARLNRIRKQIEANGGVVVTASDDPRKLLGARQEPSNLFWLFARHEI